ncbi:MAG: sporulation protein YunB [Clostridia bacterium]|nr:sporulation protein YunB [Clostridia bacterium]
MKRRWNKKNTFTFVVIFFVVFFCFYYFVAVSPVIKTYTSAETRALTEKAVNIAVSNVINRTINYDTLIDINYTSTGEISSFSANQHEINSITREIVKEAQFQMTTLGEDGLKINIGTFSGIPFLIGRGPIISLKLTPIGSVSSNFESQFQSVGINITRHTLLLYINAHISIVMPIKSYDFYTTNEVLLAESIIVGKVPEVYLNGGSLGKSLNLVP